MKRLGMWSLLPAGALVLIAPAIAFAGPMVQGRGQAVITVLPKGNTEAPIRIQQQDLQVKVNGRDSTVTGWTLLRGANSPLELVILIDDSARASFGSQLSQIEGFVKEMPSQAKMAIAYMENGRAAFNGSLSSDPAQVLNALRLPAGGAGTNGSPYFCLSDLAKNWPSTDRSARREVVMITDGIDNYNVRYDPNDPYVQSAIDDSARAGLVVFSIYWTSRGPIDNSQFGSSTGQSLLSLVTDATGGSSYWEGSGNPVSFEPYFKDLRVRFENQYRLTFDAELKGKPEVQAMKLKVGGPEAKVYSPQQVFVTPAGSSAGD